MAPFQSKLRILCIQGIIKPVDYFILKKSIVKPLKQNFKSSLPFQLNKFDDTDCKLMFRFTKRHIRRLTLALGIPDSCTTINGVRFSGKQ
jgi:hypothetical protein